MLIKKTINNLIIFLFLHLYLLVIQTMHIGYEQILY